MTEQNSIRTAEDAQQLFRDLPQKGVTGRGREECEKRIRQYFAALTSIELKTTINKGLLVAGDMNFGSEHEQAPLTPLSSLMRGYGGESGAPSEAILIGFGDDYRYISHLLEKKSD